MVHACAVHPDRPGSDSGSVTYELYKCGQRTHTPLSFCSDVSRMGRVRPSSEGVLLRAKYKVVSPLQVCSRRRRGKHDVYILKVRNLGKGVQLCYECSKHVSVSRENGLEHTGRVWEKEDRDASRSGFVMAFGTPLAALIFPGDR